MHNNYHFEVRNWAGIIIIPLIGLICSIFLVYCILKSGRPNSDGGIISTWCVLGVLDFLLIWGELANLKTVLIVQGTKIIIKRLFHSELRLDVHEIDEVNIGSARGSQYCKLIVNNKCVFIVNSACYNYDYLIKYFKINHKSIIDSDHTYKLR